MEEGPWAGLRRRLDFHFQEDKSIMTTINEQDVRSETIRVRRATERGHAKYDWLDKGLSQN